MRFEMGEGGLVQLTEIELRLFDGVATGGVAIGDIYGAPNVIGNKFAPRRHGAHGENLWGHGEKTSETPK